MRSRVKPRSIAGVCDRTSSKHSSMDLIKMGVGFVPLTLLKNILMTSSGLRE